MFLDGNKHFYRRYDPGTVGAAYAYGRLGAPSGHWVEGRSFANTTGNVVQVDAVNPERTPFDPVNVGDVICFHFPRPDGKAERTVAAKASGSQINVNTAIDLSSPAGGFAFMFLPFKSGTADSDGWHSVNHFSAITVYAEVEALASTSIQLQIEGIGDDFSTPQPLESEISLTTAGPTTPVNLDKVTPFIRIGCKATGPVAGDSITVWLIGEMLQEV